MARIDELWGAERGTAEGDELGVLALVVGKYEDEHYPMPPSNPIEGDQVPHGSAGLTPRDLEPFIGSSGRVSEVLNGRRRLSLRMIVRLHEGLRIPYECLLAGAA